uniref:Bidirectional sugar transporter SWEET n=1 Tax=Jasminum sambac TaxID=660624 RepID=A0A6G6FQS8_9LAMI|nr:sugar transporter SWEET9 [Jasminum sambac]
MAFPSVQTLAFIFGISGNIVSFMVFLAPLPTFYSIYKKKSSEGFKALPYPVALFSASLLLYYAFLIFNICIISINAIGCFIEIIYLLTYLIYSTKKDKISTLRLLLVFNVGGLGLIMAVSFLAVKGARRVTMVGWVCAALNLAVFASPLSVMRQVIRTKSVEFMPVTLSFFLTMNATMWFFYGFFIKDFFIALPNVVGFLFGIVQITLYFVYKDAKKAVDDPNLNVEKITKDSEMNLDVEGCNDSGNDIVIDVKIEDATHDHRQLTAV